ncbi:MAG: nuclear transport factor 2 family protein [Acidobacteria bacterium]|nr:nuclear transport factor 2 family protein [Acidobacteriota bacterium]
MNARKFLDTYAKAWETRDAELAASLFCDHATYHEDPFGEPLVGREAIRTYWQNATSTQKDIDFLVREPVVRGNVLIAEWGCRYTHIPTGKRRDLRGVLIAEFKGERVEAFREYWHRREAS